MLAKTLTRSLRTLFKQARPLSGLSVKFFSTSLEKIEKTKGKLQKTLAKELKYEEENYTEDNTVQKTLKDNGFTLKEKEDDFNMILEKKIGDNTVFIQFQSRQPQLNEEEGKEGEEQQKGEEQKEEPENEMQDYCDFSVFVVKADKTAIAFECSSVDGELNVNAMMPLVDLDSYLKVSKYERMSNQYNGPDFSTLDERLQQSVFEYLTEIGLTEEVIAVVEHLSLDKEQRLYMRWLKDVGRFLSE